MADATKATTPAQLWTLIHEQRRKVGNMLAALTDAEWEAASLCGAWRVRDVAAHCVETQTMTPGKFFGRFAGTGFRFNDFNEKGVRSHATQTPAELLGQYRESIARTSAPPGPKATWLAEAVIHGEDMARPIGKPLDISPEALVTTGEFCRGATLLIHGKQRSAGLRLRATDVDWTAGDGPEVSGPAASLILAITGRKAALADLSGEGVQTLVSRV